MSEPSFAPPRSSDRLLHVTRLAACFGFMVVQLDITIVNLALPTLANELAADIAGLQWVVDAYTLLFASLLLSAGAISDRFGARRSFLIGLSGFLLTSAACGFAQSVSQLVAARAGQGLFAALMVPSSLALLNHAFAHDSIQRARALAMWTASGAAAAAMGLLLGGVLLQTLGWRSIFFVNLPLCALGIVLAWRIAETPRKADRRLDMAGQVLAVVGLVGLIGAIIEMPRLGFDHAVVLGGFGLTAACAIAFALVQTRVAQPMLPLALLRLPNVAIALLSALAISLAYYGLIFVMSLYLQQFAGYTPLQTGLAYVPLTLAFIAANLLGGRLLASRGFRVTILSGLLLCASGFAWLGRLGDGDSYLWILPAFLAVAAGMGLAMPATTTMILASVDRSWSGTAAAVLNAVRQIGAGLGVALCGLLLADAVRIDVGLRTVCVVCMVGLLLSAGLSWRYIRDGGSA